MSDFIGTATCIVIVAMFAFGFSVGKQSISNDCDSLGMFYLQGTTYSCKRVEPKE